MTDSVRVEETEAAMDAALSLKTSSALVGALRMERICLHLQQALDRSESHTAEKACQEAEDHLPHLTAALANRVVAQN
ncbi:hypothetical protein [Arthrobacter sp. NicSoilB8]|uniref:hypothetical protein n=1 Tax=Arthrobacter sp. NicSoilB8 TaxID=2830998 RepID=UPI001CC789AB|nr:hypothetical protein [Arthrobacter sp. NicSoilB8]